MARDSNLQFIRDRIYEVHSAIMYNFSDEVIKLPNSIVSVVKVDDDGQLWFVCNKPVYQIQQYPPAFPIRLHFYRKGRSFHIETSGPAEIVHNPYNEGNEPDRLLIRMKMKNVSYTETPEKTKGQALQWIKKMYRSVVSHLAIPHHPRPLPGN